MQPASAATPPKESPGRKPGAPKPGHGSRTRPTNNQLLYRATFHWEHYGRALYGHPKLPEATEACASVTSAFLQVIGVLFEVERLREEGPRNILRLLSTNTRRTKVVELSSGTHRVPDELKRHSIGDGEGGQYSTNLDRNRYGSDDQYLATVVRYNLEYLDLCPCLVDVTILDAKAGDVTVVVSAGPDACACHSNGVRHPADVRQRQIRTIGSAAPEPEPEPAPKPAPAAAREMPPPRERSPSSHSGDFHVTVPSARWLDGTATSKSNAAGSELFDALLMAAAEPQVSSRPAAAVKRLQPRMRGAYSPQDADSNGDSEGKEDSPRGGGEALRRSSRKVVKLFDAAALEREESGDSDEGMSSHSLDDEPLPAARSARGGEEWERGLQLLKSRSHSRLSQRPGAASAANLTKLGRLPPSPETKRLQQEVRRLQEELQATGLVLEEARAQEAAARQQAASLQAELQLVLAQQQGGRKDGQPRTSDHLLASAVLKEAQEAILRLEHEKALLAAALTSAGLPAPAPPPPNVPTPQRNGEGLQRFGSGAATPPPPPPHSRLPPLLASAAAAALSMPLALQAIPGFQQYQRMLASLPPASLPPPGRAPTPSSDEGSNTRIGAHTPQQALPQKPAPLLARTPRAPPAEAGAQTQSHSPGKKGSGSGSGGSGSGSGGSGSGSGSGGSGSGSGFTQLVGSQPQLDGLTPAKRKLEEDVGSAARTPPPPAKEQRLHEAVAQA